MRLVGTKMDSFGTQGIKFKRRITWYPQGQLIITEAKLQDVRPTILATVQILCAPGDSRNEDWKLFLKLLWVQIWKHFDHGLTQVWYIGCIQFLGIIDLGQLKLMTWDNGDYIQRLTVLTWVDPNYDESLKHIKTLLFLRIHTHPK